MGLVLFQQTIGLFPYFDVEEAGIKADYPQYGLCPIHILLVVNPLQIYKIITDIGIRLAK